VTIENLDDYIGEAKYMSKKFYENMPAGVVIGLAYNSRGGSILYLESKRANAQDKKESVGSLKVTGQLGSVMQESSSIALTYARDFLLNPELSSEFTEEERMKAAEFLQTCDIHLHFPEGSTPKDGPSAGITITSALLSLALKKPIGQNIGMTGEISLNGKVLPIGGVKEKTMAATREGVNRLIFPKANKRDIDKLPAKIRDGVQFHFVDDYKEVFEIIFK
jgi:ATP-dependent Lon protease